MTQYKAAASGVITEEMKIVARDESISPELIRERVAAGRVVIPRNTNHAHIEPRGIGEGLRTKVNANIGTSRDFPDPDEESRKLQIAIDAGADAVMDLSTGGDLNTIRQRLLAECSLPFGTVPIYEIGALKERVAFDATKDEIFEIIERHAKQGVDFVTVHAGVTSKALDHYRDSGRVTGVVSRGGAYMLCWMERNGAENPLYAYYDELMEMLREYDVTISIGDGLRPGSIADASDRLQLEELTTIADLVRRARAAGVQAMVEGPGHVPLHQIRANVEMEKYLCDGAPFYVLGPLPTDVGAGYDHITSAIGGALAAMYGADFLCYVTPAEHLGLPAAEDVRRGVLAARLAAHCADVAKGIPGAAEWDRRMSLARKRLDWDEMRRLALDPDQVDLYRRARPASEEDVCSMCGFLCPMRLANQIFEDAGTG
jgi:phosphomethylpyrimidine synthase